jgi:hypothetical protein
MDNREYYDGTFVPSVTPVSRPHDPQNIDGYSVGTVSHPSGGDVELFQSYQTVPTRRTIPTGPGPSGVVVELPTQPPRPPQHFYRPGTTTYYGPSVTNDRISHTFTKAEHYTPPREEPSGPNPGFDMIDYPRPWS